MGFTCVLRPSGHVACWGLNDYGQVGSGNKQPSRKPVLVAGIADARSIALGERTSYALRANGEVLAWGSNIWGECEPSNAKSEWMAPAPVPGVSDAVALDAGSTFACAVKSTGELLCWGTETLIPLDASFKERRAPAHAVLGVNDAVRVAIGSGHMCILRRDRSASCWGSNDEGALGDGTREQRTVPTAVLNLGSTRQIAAGRHACALRSNGEPYCWGFNASGELGDGTTVTRLFATRVASLEGIRFIDTNLWTDGGCAVGAKGSVACWGLVANPQAWGRSVPPLTRAKSIEGVEDALQVAATRWSACVLHKGGKVACWGDAARIGRDTGGLYVNRAGPVSGLSDAVHVSVGVSHGCAVRRTGAVVCWGTNEHGQRGDSSPQPRAVPQEVPSVSDAVGISSGSRHTCAVLKSGRVTCWGQNEHGELGASTSETRSGPVLVVGIKDAQSVAAGGDSTCALRRNGQIMCWGTLDQDSSSILAPSPVKKINHATQVFADELDLFGRVTARYCAIEQAGGYACWGHHVQPDVLTAQAMKGISGARSGALGGNYGCVVRSNGRAYCSVPVDQQLRTPDKSRAKIELYEEHSFNDAVSVAESSNTRCVLRASGIVVCSGGNFKGQRGDGTFSGSGGHDDGVLGLTEAVELSSGEGFFCALRKNGSVWCWGNNAQGRQGTGELLEEVVTQPVAVSLPD